MTPEELEFWPKTEEIDKPLYLAQILEPIMAAKLQAKGWLPIDVRLLANANPDDRRSAWFKWMEGINMGTIDCDAKRLKFFELEGRALKILVARDLPERAKDTEKLLNKAGLNDILTLQSEHAFRGFVTGPAKIGGPKGVRESKPRAGHAGIANLGAKRKFGPRRVEDLPTVPEADQEDNEVSLEGE